MITQSRIVVQPSLADCDNYNYIKKGKSIPITGLDRPRGFQEAEAARFQDNRHMKVVMLSALGTGRLYPPCWSAFLLEAKDAWHVYLNTDDTV